MHGLQKDAMGGFVEEQAMMHGHWYHDRNRQLYIVPNNIYGDGDCEAAGPDKAVIERLNELYRGKKMFDVDTGEVEDELGLERISELDYRFDDKQGYFAA